MSSETGSRIAKNSIFNIVRTVLTVPITLMLTPYVIFHLGKQEFGVWALVGVISSYAQLSDFGITDSLIKFMAEYRARNEVEKLNQLINTAFTVYLLLSVVCGSLFLLILPFIVNRVLSVPQMLQEKANYVFAVAVILFFVNMLMGVFGSLIVGFQRMGYSNLITIISTVLSAFGTIFFISQGKGLVGLIYNNAIVTGLTVIANLFAAKHLFPELRFNPIVHFNRKILQEIFNFSWKIQITNLTQLLIFQLDRVLLSHYVGLEAVSYYEVANRIASQSKSFIASIFSPMVPAASALHAVENNDKIVGLYKRSFKYMAITAVPCMLLLISLSHPFIRTWMGQGYETSALTMQLLLTAYMLTLLTGPGAFILSGINKPQIGMQASIFAGITNLVLCLYLVQAIGYYGVVIGIFITILTSGIYFIWMVHKNIPGLNWSIYPHCLLKPFIVSAILAICLALIDKAVPIHGYAPLCAIGIGYVAITGIVLYKGKYFDDFDRETLSKLNPLRRG